MTRMLSNRDSLAGDRQVKIHVLGGRYGNYQRGGDNWITVSQSRLTQTIQRIQRTGGKIVDMIVEPSSVTASLGFQSFMSPTAKSTVSKSSNQKQTTTEKPMVAAEQPGTKMASADVVPLRPSKTRSNRIISKSTKQSQSEPAKADLTVLPVPDAPVVTPADISKPQPITPVPNISHPPKEDIPVTPVASPAAESASSPEIPSLSRNKRITRGFSDSSASSSRKKRRKSRRKSKKYLLG